MFALDDSPAGVANLDRAIELLERANAELETRSIAPVEAAALREGFLEVRRLAKAGRDSVLSAHQKSSEGKGPC